MNLREECLGADILIVAIGQAHLVKGELLRISLLMAVLGDWIKPGVIAIDSGINGGQRSRCKRVTPEYDAKSRGHLRFRAPGSV
jgi:5,10-methylene-tetrahydrofolate dehydrogenase/methenyl tetrahydrofolate cyclohydrolase